MSTEEIEKCEVDGEKVGVYVVGAYGIVSSSVPKLKTRVPVKETF